MPNRSRSAALAVLAFAIAGMFAPASARETAEAESESRSPGESEAAASRDCISVELIMYSGRPRPKYLVCDQDEKAAVLKKLDEVKDGMASDSSQPLESTSAYQGVLVTLPGETSAFRHRIVGRGKVNDLDEKRSRTDSGRRLERFFLDLGEFRENISGPKGGTMRDQTGMARTQLDRDE